MKQKLVELKVENMAETIREGHSNTLLLLSVIAQTSSKMINENK